MNLRSMACTAALLLTLAVRAQASLITSTTATGNTVIDDITNQEWLNLEVTTGMSVADALALGATDGFHWGTTAELNALLDHFYNYNFDPLSRAGDYVAVAPTTLATVFNWYHLFGVTFFDSHSVDIGRASGGFYDDGVDNGPNVESAYGLSEFPGQGNSANNVLAFNPNFSAGVFLVRDIGNAEAIPEPTTLTLVGLGVAGLARRRRKPSR